MEGLHATTPVCFRGRTAVFSGTHLTLGGTLIRASVQDDFNGWTSRVLDVGIAEPQVFKLSNVTT
jgi:hypothetical protein